MGESGSGKSTVLKAIAGLAPEWTGEISVLGQPRGHMVDHGFARSYAALLEGSVMIETVFSWPGIGNYLTVALLNADMNAVLGATLVIGAVFILINKLSDVLYRVLDPRSR